MKFDDLFFTKEGHKLSTRCLRRNLKKLRGECCVNSLYISDYVNSFGLNKNVVFDFFEGYVDYLYELAEDKYDGKSSEVDVADILKEYDTIDNLEQWYLCHDDFGDENL